MYTQKRNPEKILHCCLFVIFIIYLILLLRITLFKQTALYNLLSAIGTGSRTISMIPFYSIYEMAVSNISIGRIAENILGNIILFMPFGIIFPLITNGKFKKILTAAIIFSLSIEIIQFLFALGSADIDDLLFNTLGAYIGLFITNTIRKKSNSNIKPLILVTLLSLIMGSGILGYLLIHQTHLFLYKKYETVVENEALVESFIDTPKTVAGKFIKTENSVLIIEKNVGNSQDNRETMEFEVTKNSNIYICYDKTEYFFSAVSGEYQRYDKIDYRNFIQQANLDFDKSNNVMIWSADGKKIDNLVIIEWVE